MSNPYELRLAQKNLEQAMREIEQVKALPRRVGQMIQWQNSGLIWRRVGNNAWVPLHESNDFQPTRWPSGNLDLYSSVHVATVSGWRVITKLPEVS